VESPIPALRSLSLHVAEGEIVGLLGSNGAGKTTLLKTLATLVVPDGGEGWISGYPLEDEDGVRRSVGLMTSEERSFYWRLTGRENLHFFASMYGLDKGDVDERLRQLLDLLHLDDFIDRRFDAYSSGMKQRLALARSLLHRPRVLLLDEPTRSIDPVESLSLRATIAEMAREESMAVLLVTHNLREMEMLCHRVVVVREGVEVFQGTLAELRNQVGRPGRFVLELDAPLDDWEEIPSILEGEQRFEKALTELAVELTPESCVGDVVTEIHSKGGRIEAVREESSALEHALTQIAPSTESALSLLPPCPERQPEKARPVRRIGQFVSFVRRDIRIHLSYRFAFAMGIFGIAFNVAIFYYLAQLVSEARVPGFQKYGADFFPFILIGIAFRGYLGVALLQFGNSLRSEQMMGTLEMLLATPLRVSTLIAASASFTFLYQTITVAGYLLIGLGMGSLSLSRMNLPVATLVMIPTIATFAAVGMISAAFLMTFKRGDPVNFFLNAGATLFGGVFFPVEVLPASLQLVSRALPITYSLQAMRKTLLTGAGIADVSTELLVLTGFSLVLVPLGLSVFGAALRKARRDGTVGQF
jgi:ABC-2 type transport system permease protein